MFVVLSELSKVSLVIMSHSKVDSCKEIIDDARQASKLSSQFPCGVHAMTPRIPHAIKINMQVIYDS